MQPPKIHPSPAASGAERPGDPTDPEAVTRALLEKSPLLVYICDLEFRIALINRGLRELSGYDTTDCPNVESLLRRFYPDERYRSVVAAIHDGWKRNEHIRGAELVVQCRDGQQRTISWSTARLKVARGTIHGYIAVGVDVTTRRSLEQWVNLLQKSLQHVQEGIVLTDPLGRVLAWNQGAQRLLGYEERAMQGRFLSELYQRTERELLARSIDRAVESSGLFAGEVELERADGRPAILPFHQHRIDGEGGAALARLTVLTAPQEQGGAGVRGDFQRASAEVERLNATLASARAEIAERDERVRARDRAIEELRSLAEAAAEGGGADLKKALEETQRRTLDAEGRLAAVARQAEEAERMVREADDRAATAAVEGAEATARAQAAEEALRAAETTVLSLQSQLAAAQAPDPEVAASLTAARSAVEQARSEAAEARERAQVLEENLRRAEAALDAAREELAAARSAADESRAGAGVALESERQRIAALSVEVDAQRSGREAAEAALAQSRAESEAALSQAGTEREAAMEALREALTSAAATEREGLEQAHAERLAQLEAERERAIAEARDAQAEADGEAADELRARVAAAEAQVIATAQEQESRFSALQRELQNSRTELADAERLGAERAQALAERDTRIEALQAELAASKAELELSRTEAQAAELRRHEERARIDEEHRNLHAEALSRAADERRTLEDQLHKDILAAEERAATERTALETRLAGLQKEWADTLTIARAEGESALRAASAGHESTTEALRAELARVPPLQAFLAPIREAILCVDTEGHIVAFSGGAAALSGRHASVVLGQTAHEAVFKLPGLDWRSLFAKVVIAGRVEQQVEVATARGPRPSLLRATLVRNPAGRPIGVTEWLSDPPVVVPDEVHGLAALGQQASRALPEAQRAVEAAAAAFTRATAHHRDLLDLARDVDRAGTVAELESTARRVDLRRLLSASPADDRAVEAALLSARTALRDVEDSAAWLGADSIRWNELVDRTLLATQSSASRDYGDTGLFRGPVALAAAALMAAAPSSTAISTTRAESGQLRATFAGSTADLAFVRLRARLVGGTAERDGSALSVLLPASPETATFDAPLPDPAPPPASAPPELPSPPGPVEGAAIRGEGDAGPSRREAVQALVQDTGLVAMAGEDSVAGPMVFDAAPGDGELLDPDPPSDADHPAPLLKGDATPRAGEDDVDLVADGDASFAERAPVSSDLFAVARDVEDFARGGFEVSDELGELEVEAAAEDPAEEVAVEIAGEAGDDGDDLALDGGDEADAGAAGVVDAEGGADEGPDAEDGGASSGPAPARPHGKKKKKNRR